MKAVLVIILMAFVAEINFAEDIPSTNAATSSAGQISALRKQVDDAYAAYTSGTVLAYVAPQLCNCETAT
jgi:hypothetical protein